MATVWSFVLSCLLSVVLGAQALILYCKLELAAILVLFFAVLFATPFDRYLILAAAAAWAILGFKYGRQFPPSRPLPV